jgi:CheY-like chemotaxis protein
MKVRNKKDRDYAHKCQAILVVEDDEDIRDLVTDILENEGFQVESAANGAEGLRKLEKMPVPTLVFLDLMMPSMNGWEFLDARKKDKRLAGHRVVTISALKPSESLDDPTPLKVDGAIAKPLSLERIWNNVNRYCRKPSTALAS